MSASRMPDKGPARHQPKPPVHNLPDVRRTRDFGSVGGDPARRRTPDFGSVERKDAKTPRVPDFGSRHRDPGTGPSR